LRCSNENRLDSTIDMVKCNHRSFLGHQMHVPDSITVGPSRSAMSRLHVDSDRLPVRMEVPDRIRPGKNI
jgi:hypothetical protein